MKAEMYIEIFAKKIAKNANMRFRIEKGAFGQNKRGRENALRSDYYCYPMIAL